MKPHISHYFCSQSGVLLVQMVKKEEAFITFIVERVATGEKSRYQEMSILSISFCTKQKPHSEDMLYWAFEVSLFS